MCDVESAGEEMSYRHYIMAKRTVSMLDESRERLYLRAMVDSRREVERSLARV
jgi:hypothetical protein